MIMETRQKLATKAPFAEVEHQIEEEGWQLLPTELLSRVFLELELRARYISSVLTSTSPSYVGLMGQGLLCMPELASLSIKVFGPAMKAPKRFKTER